MEEAADVDDIYADPCHHYGSLYGHFLLNDPRIRYPKPSTSATGSSSDDKKGPSMLVTGFGIRNFESLQRALLDDEQRRQMLLARHDKDEEFECLSIETSSTKLQTKSSFTLTEESETDMSSRKLLPLEYLMGIASQGEYQEKGQIDEKGRMAEIEGERDYEEGRKMTLAMRKARKYLREHRIFEFFQFIIAHMLSELPENPIQFIMDLLDRCLMYRSGFGNPPLLYEKPHLEQLFYLMDRMKTGFIEVDQYVTGMKTLGICNYDKKPPLSTDGMVSQETFVEEAYDCLTDLFVDMIRRRGGDLTPPSLMTPPPTEVKSVATYVDDVGDQ